ncbi:MAG TPA: hypothetical protein G4O04_04515 [Anaerolineae bacterium]|nr:hypothetical protein [Anaerolineae bacterium]HID83612.1 hypothetical protein [Anaerolineales bacterium]HIQ09494.1 hypothetical protein [Anaerolineaceae bacterium]
MSVFVEVQGNLVAAGRQVGQNYVSQGDGLRGERRLSLHGEHTTVSLHNLRQGIQAWRWKALGLA